MSHPILLALLALWLCAVLPAWGQTRVLDLRAVRPAIEAFSQTVYRVNPLTVRIALDPTRPSLTGKEFITAAAGLPAGSLWQDAGTLRIVPP